MAKTARRSVASNPSSLTSYSVPNSNSIHYHSNHTTYRKRSSVILSSDSSTTTSVNTESSSLPSQSSTIQSESSVPTTVNSAVDPLRSTGFQYTTHIIPNNNFTNSHGSTPTIQSTSSTNNNSSKNFNNVNANRTTPAETSSRTPPPPPSLPPTSVNSTAIRSNFNSTASAILAAERERMRMEFYATYDVMTGVRIAATLGGFFGLMVFLIVWKSRSHSSDTLKALKDPKTAALAVACMQEEEDRKIIEAMDATGLSIFPDEYDTMLFRRQRMLSIGNVSAPPIFHRGFRFSSVGGGYSSLLEPPRRSSFSYGGSGRRKSASESSRILCNYPMGSSFGTDDFFIETDDELAEDYEHLKERDDTLIKNQGFLEVPALSHPDTRRSSAMTCCSTESSYLERRCSALTLGINNLPPSLRQKLVTSDNSPHGSSTELWDYYYPDIQVIQPTPKTSPCPSDKDNYDKKQNYGQTRTLSQETTTTAGSGVSSITVDSTGSSWQHHLNSISCYYDPESLQDRRLPSIDSEQSLDFYQQNITEGDDDSIEQSNKNDKHRNIKSLKTITTTTKDKYDDNNELKLKIVKSKLSDTSSCINNNNSFSYYMNNNNNGGNGGIIYPDNKIIRPNLRGAGNIGGTGIGRAPLASCSSFKMSSIECQDSDLRSSLGDDDSVFIESYADTDDDLEQFSTDSDEISLGIDDEQHGITQYIDERIAPSLPLTADLQYKIQEQQISTRSAPAHILRDNANNRNGFQNTERHQNVSKGAILKSSHRPPLETHRTLSVSSSDKALLVPTTKSSKRSTRHTSTTSKNILETHFSTPPSQKKRFIQQEELLLKPSLSPANTPLLTLKRTAQFQKQYSDPHSLPTTTDEATTTLETCSTEVPVVVTTIVTTTLTGTATTTSVFTPSVVGVIRKQIQQKPPITIKKQSSFSYDNNNDSSVSSSSNSIHRNLNNRKRFSSNKLKMKNRNAFSEGTPITTVAKMPTPTVSTVNAAAAYVQPSKSGVWVSGINFVDSTKLQQPNVEITSSHLSSSSNTNPTNKNKEIVDVVNFVIEPTKQSTKSSVKNKCNIISNKKIKVDKTIKPITSTSVMLELPVIRLPTETEDDDSSSSCSNNKMDGNRGRARSKSERCDPPIRDPSLAGSSRKWSKETLF